MEKEMRTLTRAAAVLATALLVLACAILPVCGDATPRGVGYKNFDYWGGNWSDAEKSPTNSNDDLLCWAATASNVLAYTGWGNVDGMSNSDSMFAYYIDHWTDVGGLMDFAWDWWFDGTNGSQGLAGWSQVYSPGGGFYPNTNFWSYYHEDWTASRSMSAIDQFLRLGCGVGLAVYGGGAHAITCWGYNYDPESPSTYYGIWVSDSDDDKNLTSPPDRLRYYDVAYSSTYSRWYIQNFYGTNNWYIGGVEGLQLIPEPTSMLALMVGLFGLALRRRYHR
jgi:hypothetical protein